MQNINTECELKFKLQGNLKEFLKNKHATKFNIVQTYLNLEDYKTLEFVKQTIELEDTSCFAECRVRIINKKNAFITLKSKGDLERKELEKEIPLSISKQIKNLSLKGQVKKTRYDLDLMREIVISIDNYEDRDLIIAEVEFDKNKIDKEDLEHMIINFFKDFKIENVTNDKSYKNSNLAK